MFIFGHPHHGLCHAAVVHGHGRMKLFVAAAMTSFASALVCHQRATHPGSSCMVTTQLERDEHCIIKSAITRGDASVNCLQDASTVPISSTEERKEAKQNSSAPVRQDDISYCTATDAHMVQAHWVLASRSHFHILHMCIHCYVNTCSPRH